MPPLFADTPAGKSRGGFLHLKKSRDSHLGIFSAQNIVRLLNRDNAYFLAVAAKYLTTIIRKTSGRTAAEWIDDYVVLEAKNLLKYSTMSIQEIAYCLNFPNQSFFGKYFRSHTGMTPSAYRMSK